MTRWLFEYSQENFRRQHHLNRILFACIEELALENARLRRELTERSHEALTRAEARLRHSSVRRRHRRRLRRTLPPDRRTPRRRITTSPS